jgi:hypothetical protein
MEFVLPCPPPKPLPIPSGWQCTVDQTAGDAFYVNATSGQVVYQYDDMFRMLKKPPKHSFAISPTHCSVKSGNENVIPDVAILSLIYLTPPTMSSSSKCMDVTVAKPINLDNDEVSLGSQALSDLTNLQLPKTKEKKSF